MRLLIIPALFVAAAVTMGCAERDEIIATVPVAGDGGGGAGGEGGSGAVISFGQPSVHDVACGEAVDLGVADVDGDGQPDLLVGGDCLNVHRGQGDGDFQLAQAAVSTNFGSAFALGFIDTSHPQQPSDPIDVVGFAQSARVFTGDGLGGFQHLSDVPAAGPGAPGTIGLAQLYGDDALELITSSGSELSLWSGDGAGAFVGPHTIQLSSAVHAHAHGDLDGDGHADLVVVSDGVSVVLNMAAGNFSMPMAMGATGARSVALADVDGDDCLDVVAIAGRPGQPAGSSGELQLLRNDCTGVLTAELIAPLPFAADIAIADVDGDGLADLVASRAGAEPALLVMTGHGDGRFDEPQSQSLEGEPGRLVVADFDADGRPDVAVTIPTRAAAAVLLNQTP